MQYRDEGYDANENIDAGNYKITQQQELNLLNIRQK